MKEADNLLRRVLGLNALLRTFCDEETHQLLRDIRRYLSEVPEQGLEEQNKQLSADATTEMEKHRYEEPRD